MKPTCRVRQRANCASDMAEITWSPTQTSPSAGPVEPGDQVQQRGLARAAGAHQAEELAFGHVERQLLEHVDPLAAAAEELVHAADAHDQAVVGRCCMPWRSA